MILIGYDKDKRELHLMKKLHQLIFGREMAVVHPEAKDFFKITHLTMFLIEIIHKFGQNVKKFHWRAVEQN
jgi:hypothetical protein